MIKVKCFMRDESPLQPGKYIIRPIHDAFHLDYTEGSFAVICARLFNLDYPDYLRMCRDCFGAELIGKGTNYPIAYFKRSKELDALVDLLNARANLVLWERENPDHDEHAAFVKEKNPRFYEEVVNGKI